MKTLLWKEFRQHWMLVVAGAVLSLTIVLVDALEAALDTVFFPEDLPVLVLLTYAVMVGSVTVAGDVASGAIVEIFSRPISPRKVWFSKTLFGLVLSLVPALAYLASYHAFQSSFWVENIDIEPGALVFVSSFAFAVAMFASTVASKSMHALPGALLCGAAYLLCWGGLIYKLERMLGFLPIEPESLIFGPAILAGTLLFLACSSVIFLRGRIHTGLTGSKWRLATGLLAIGFTLFCGAYVTMHLVQRLHHGIEGLLVSPDRTKVAAVIQRTFEPRIAAVRIIDIESGKSVFPDVCIKGDAIHSLNPDLWSPDSTRFATWHYAVKPLQRIDEELGDDRLGVINLETKTLYTVSDIDMPISWRRIFDELVWSESGKTLYRVVNVSSRERFSSQLDSWIDLISPDGNFIRRIEINDPLASFSSFIPGDPPLFPYRYGLKGEDGRLRIPAVRADTGDVIDLTTGSPFNTEPVKRGTRSIQFGQVSPDRRYVAYIIAEYENADRLPVTSWTLFLRDLHAGTQKIIHEGDGLSRPSVRTFSPDSKRFLLHISVLPDGFSSYIVDVGQGDLSPLTADAWPWPCWSPDGKSLAYVSSRPFARVHARDGKLAIITFDGAETARKTLATDKITACDWLSDDELLYAEGNALYRIKVDGTGRKKVYPR